MSGREEYLEEVRDQIRVAKARSSDSDNQLDMPRTNLLGDATARLVRKRLQNKRRVYVNDPSEAPEGADVQEGPRGGLYFETGGGESRRTPREIAVGYPQLRLSSIHEYRDNENRYESYTKSKKMNTEELRERMRMARKYAPQRKLVSNATAKLVRKRLQNKRRVYITDPSEAPDSADVEEGPRGGMYYETGGTSSGQSTFGEGEKPPGYLGGPGNPIPDSIDDVEADLPTDTAVNYGDANPDEYGGHWMEYDDSGEYFRAVETYPARAVLTDEEIESSDYVDRDTHFITEAYVDMDQIFENPDDLSAGLTEDGSRAASSIGGQDDLLAFAVENPTAVASDIARYYGGDGYTESGDYDDIMAGFGIDSTTNV